ncbi:MAG TPA: helix-turn-helix domain-containing protein [Usitatibacter sp.]|nr:helix-turn-helix domain-containing protein [Usitatibacter sp.]
MDIPISTPPAEAIAPMPGKPPVRGRQVACTACAMHPLCFPLSAAEGWLNAVQTRRRLAKGERLYRAGLPQSALFAVRAGFLKACAPGADGGRFIVRFLLPGDAAGLDAFADGVHPTEAIALEDSQVCEIPRHRAEVLAEGIPSLGAQLRKLIGAELARSQEHSALLTRHAASERVARFLLDLSKRWEERGYSKSAFRLPMRRREIGEHLGLTMETVSRILSDFQVRGWIRLSRGGVEILPGAKLDEADRA